MPSRMEQLTRFRFRLRSLLVAMTGLCLLLGGAAAVYQWRAVEAQERRARASLHPYGGVFSMASALYNRRTGGESKGWFYNTFLNRVESVDLSPHNWAAKKRRGEILLVDDDALAVLDGFRRLRSLDLRDTQVTDSGVKTLAVHRRLEDLDLRGTRITVDGVERLREALPDCEVTWDGDPLF